jgi:hypothetical protein
MNYVGLNIVIPRGAIQRKIEPPKTGFKRARNMPGLMLKFPAIKRGINRPVTPVTLKTIIPFKKY